MASILTPCDKGFPQKGIAAESASNEETVISAEVETDMLYEIRKAGAATTLKDRRWDMIDYLYKFESEEPTGSKNRV
jgi:predicted amidohydrolase